MKKRFFKLINWIQKWIVLIYAFMIVLIFFPYKQEIQIFNGVAIINFMMFICNLVAAFFAIDDILEKYSKKFLLNCSSLSDIEVLDIITGKKKSKGKDNKFENCRFWIWLGFNILIILGCCFYNWKVLTGGQFLNLYTYINFWLFLWGFVLGEKNDKCEDRHMTSTICERDDHVRNFSFIKIWHIMQKCGRCFTKKWIVILAYVFVLLIFWGVCYWTVNSDLDDNVKVSIISSVGIIITATISVCTLLFNAEQQRIAEFRKVKITYYNKFIETLYNALSNTTNNSDSNSNEGKMDAQAEFIMEFNRLPLYASEEVIKIADKKTNVNALINEIRKDLVIDKYAVFKDLNFEFKILNKGDNKEDNKEVPE